VLSLFFSSEGAALHSDNDVVIVGAGVSGLYAAYALNDPGYDVLLVEATNRHGGRVQDALFGEVGIELGGEELYGPLNNFIFDDIASLSPPLGGSAIWARLSGRNLREHSNERLQTHQS
jgi:phytoene dehydrogenase-like protein